MIDLNAEMQFWVDALALQLSGWKFTWAWADHIPLDDGRSAFGLNSLNADERTSHIQIKKPVTQKDMDEFVDTCAHEVSHCWGAEVERRLLEAKTEQERTQAHEYIAETLAPALTRIKNTPREMAFAKAIKSLSQKTEAFAKVAQSMPARAKEQTNMPEDIASLEKAMIEARLAGDSAKALELLDKVIALKASGQGGDSGPPSVPTVDPLAAAPPMGDKPVDPNATPAAKPLEEQGYAKAIEVLIAARPDLTKEQRAYAKACKSLDTAATYLITIPFAKTQQEPKAAPAKPLDDKAPRPGANDGQMRLGKTDKDSVLAVAKAMGQATEPVRGPTILTGPDGSKKFTLGNLTPTQYRAKRATGWDPRKTFPLGSEVAQ